MGVDLWLPPPLLSLPAPLLSLPHPLLSLPYPPSLAHFLPLSLPLPPLHPNTFVQTFFEVFQTSSEVDDVHQWSEKEAQYNAPTFGFPLLLQ